MYCIFQWYFLGMGLLDPSKRWPQNTVPYEFVGYNQDDINIVREAMNEIQASTCIRFVEHTYEENFVQFLVG